MEKMMNKEALIQEIEASSSFTSSISAFPLRMVTTPHFDWLISQAKAPDQRLSYEIYKDSSVTHADLDGVKEHMDLEQLRDMEKKRKQILENCWGFKDIKDRAFAEKMFEYGYLASFTYYAK
jgi:hypothetical protein